MCTTDHPSATQIKMLALAAQGNTREEIGRELAYSPWYVKECLDGLRVLLGARNVTHAVSICVLRGHLLIDIEHEVLTTPELELRTLAA